MPDPERFDRRVVSGSVLELLRACRLDLSIQRDTGHLVRARVRTAEAEMELDVVHEPVPDLGPPTEIEGVDIESLTDLRANKITCLLSRSGPRDLVDLFFLDRAGFPAEDDLELALAKDAGIDPGILAWLLRQFPVEPMPQMLEELSTSQLRQYRDQLAERLRALAVDSS